MANHGPSPAFRRSTSWWIVVVAGALVVVFVVAGVRELVKSRQVRQQIRNLQQDVVAQEQRHDQLTNLIAYLQSPTFQERAARLQLGLKKSGERVVIVPPSNTNGLTNTLFGSVASADSAANQPASMPRRWWNYFFGSAGLHKST